jgi:hypothetical protein
MRELSSFPSKGQSGRRWRLPRRLRPDYRHFRDCAAHKTRASSANLRSRMDGRKSSGGLTAMSSCRGGYERFRKTKVSSLICVEELHASPVIPCVQTRLQLCAMDGRAHPVPGQGEVLLDRIRYCHLVTVAWTQFDGHRSRIKKKPSGAGGLSSYLGEI